MTEPYYQDDAVTLYCGDCRDVTVWLDADVLVTDPPYGTQNGGYGRRQNALGPGTVNRGRDGIVIVSDLDTSVRDDVLRRWAARPALVFGSPRMSEPPGVWADRLVWDKKRPGMNGGPWRYRHESIFVTAGFVRTSNAEVSIISCWPDQAEHIHAKPLELMSHLVAAAPRGTIADPFAGSGSTLVAAKMLGRKAVGVEIEERYCEVAANRLRQGVLDFGGAA